MSCRSSIFLLVAGQSMLCGGELGIAHASEGESIAPVPSRAAASETPGQRDIRMKWWREAKFGMFIHWGVYAVPARGSEWIMHRERIPVATYRQIATEFNPIRYDPRAWARLAKDAGMRYVVITAKHHDGFALYPSDASDWDIADATPYGRDLLGPLVDAAHGEGLKIGFYYSQAQDWVNPGGAKARYDEGEGWDPAQNGKFDEYLSRVALAQTRELITRYRPDVFWWDTPTWMNPKRAKPFHDLVSTVPGIITNNRLGGGYGGETKTPEQFVPITGYKGDWETCMTIGCNWGYVANDMERLKPTEELIQKLADVCSKGGNLLLNVGPAKDGTIDPGMVHRLREIGSWLSTNGESIYGTSGGPFHRLSWGCATRKDQTLYLHVFDWPEDGKLRVPLKSRTKSAYLLADPSRALRVTPESERIIIELPASSAHLANTVVVVGLEEEPVVQDLPTRGATVEATTTDGHNVAANVLDGTGDKRWRAPRSETEGALELTLEETKTISGYGFDEPDVWPRLKQEFTLSAMIDGAWHVVSKGVTNGHGSSGDFQPVTASKFRLHMSCATGSPGVAELQLYQPE